MLIAVAIIRVSQPKGREGESFSSPKDQLEIIERLCGEKGWSLPDENVFYEMKVSGDAPLEDRPGLSRGVTLILTGMAHVIVGAHSERLWWSHEVRAQVLRIVSEAGGEVWADDIGCLTSRSAAEDFGSEVRTSADRFSRRQNAEKSRKAVVRAVRRGVVPFPKTPPGIAKDEDGRPVPTADAPFALRAFEMRDEDATTRQIRDYLRSQGIDRSLHAVWVMLANRLYVGELHFGDLKNLHAMDPPIVPRALFDRVQRKRMSRGRNAKSERLLARLGVLKHDGCGARMFVGTQIQGGRAYDYYRCPTNNDCSERVTITAHIAESFVVDAVRQRLADAEGTASAEEEARQAAVDREKAEADIAAAIRAFAGFEGEDAARERLDELAAVRDEAVERDDRLRSAGVARRVTADDWDDFTLAERRALIRSEVAAVWVTKHGRGVDRLRIEFFGK